MQKRHKQAAQNREDLLEAAVTIFRKNGIRAPLQMIIDEAQVGRATFYRNFKDRRALVIALMEHSLQLLNERAQYFSQFPDGLIQMIENHVHHLPSLTALMEYWRVIDRNDPIIIQMYDQRNMILKPLIDQAIQHKICRADLTPEDYALITGILRASFQGLTDEEQIKLARRAVELLIHGIKA